MSYSAFSSRRPMDVSSHPEAAISNIGARNIDVAPSMAGLGSTSYTSLGGFGSTNCGPSLSGVGSYLSGGSFPPSGVSSAPRAARVLSSSQVATSYIGSPTSTSATPTASYPTPPSGVSSAPRAARVLSSSQLATSYIGLPTSTSATPTIAYPTQALSPVTGPSPRYTIAPSTHVMKPQVVVTPMMAPTPTLAPMTRGALVSMGGMSTPVVASGVEPAGFKLKLGAETPNSQCETTPGISVNATDDVGENDDWSDDEENTVSGERKEIGGPPIQISIAPCKDDDAREQEIAVSISVPDPEGAGTVGRVASDVCCVIDISGSMSNEATYEDENENVKSDGLSYLDIVKHAVKTVVHMLGDNDRLALVAFDDKAEVAFASDYMTVDGRKRAVEALEELSPRGRTSIWKGLKAGLDALRTAENIGGMTRPKTILLLTDGLPNDVPERGHIAELRDYKECHPGFGFMINTFGFGYKLDSALLLDLAVEGHGTYGFIPDALIVGTSFVNSIANVLSTLTQNATVHLSAVGGAQFRGPVMGTDAQMMTETSWGRVVNLGPLQLGGTREIVLPMLIPAGEQHYLEATLVYTGPDGKERQAFGKGITRKVEKFSMCALGRGDTVDVSYEAVNLAVGNDLPKAQEKITQLDGRLKVTGNAEPWVATLQGDVAGRVSKSLQGEPRFNRWGKHYLRAFTRAHQIQYCTNFMDQSVQDYGGSLFKALREEGDQIFVSLPPPTKQQNVQSQRRASAPVSTPVPNMNVYYAGSGGG